jgi:hypothetical protein
MIDMFNPKRKLIESIMVANDYMSELNGQNTDNKGFMTYFTSNGWITGKPADLEYIDFSTDKGFEESLKDDQGNYKNISVFSLGNSIYQKHAEDYERENEAEVTESNQAIHLTDVTIKTANGSIARTEGFTLFVDQVIGVIPGKGDVDNI